MEDAPVLFSSIKRSRSLSDRVVEEVTQAIVAGKLQTGQALPSERDLCKQFDVSRTVVREAIRSLAAKGLAKPSTGRGMLIARPDVDAVSESITLFLTTSCGIDYRAVHEVRAAIETQVAGLSAERASDEEVSGLRDICVDFEGSVAESAFSRAMDLDCQFHRSLAQASGNGLLEALIYSMADILREIRRKTMDQPGVAEGAVQMHWKIFKAVERHDPERAREAMAEHLQQALEVWSD